jgi:hypothetical protein
MRSPLAAVLLAVAIAGCQSNNPESLQREIVRLKVFAGMPRDLAVKHLQRGGFSCDRDGPGGLTCTRIRSYYMVSTCVQRVNLALDPAGRTVTGVQMRDPACAGL